MKSDPPNISVPRLTPHSQSPSALSSTRGGSRRSATHSIPPPGSEPREGCAVMEGVGEREGGANRGLGRD